MTPRDSISSRMYVVATLITLLPVVLAARAVHISLIDGPALRSRVETQSTSSISIAAMRGSIDDAAGRSLAVNVRTWTLAVDPTTKAARADMAAWSADIARAANLPVSSVRRKIGNRSSTQYAVIARGIELPKEQMDALRAMDGVRLEEGFDRKYHHGTATAHVLGHVDTDLRGISGLELLYDELLTGTPGRQEVRRDRMNRRSFDVGLARVEPRHGESIVLTIDLVMQEIMEQELARGVEAAGANWGVAVAMDPRSGAILGMANWPTYDPNNPGSHPMAAQRNHAINDLIEPGSTFKLIAAVAAVESGRMSLADTVDTGVGVEVRSGYELRDTHMLGRVTFREVIQESSNIGMAHIADRLDRGRFYAYARDFGFDQPTWVDLPGEESGRVKHPDRWSATTPSALSRGYEIQVTPLQMLAAYASLANRGVLVRPYVVQARYDAEGRLVWRAETEEVRRVFTRETAEALIPAFEAVVDSGTATQARLESVRVAGKTGTASKYINGGYSRTRYRATFAGFFPVEDPTVAMIVIMDEPRSSIYGGAVSAPVFRNIASRWLSAFPQLGSAPAVDAPGADAPTPDVRVPDRADPDRADLTDPRPVVASLSGQTAPVTEVSLEEGRMPDLRGLSARQAVALVMSAGGQVTLSGEGVVREQWPAPGAEMASRARLVLRP
ncbi:MAG: penicillin-binding protein [Bacteroidetes bacterium CG12_big_fil_rev_8_21_14_0_65_60_17]|nr:MAG: penicillin-binding protein [Bacteroidetes bacterium CG12_big_fil_rev_8_21_14_0_65_60_17]